MENLEAEYAVLGMILKKGDLMKETTLEGKHFYHEFNRTLFSTLQKLEKKGELIDIVSVMSELGQDALSNIGGKKHLSKLMNSVASFEPFKRYEKYIMEAYKVREANKLKTKDIRELSDVSDLMNELAQLEQTNNDDEYDHKEALVKLYDEIDQQQEGLSGFDTGFRELNKYLDGFQKGDLIISAARPSVGKTAKMLNHALKHSGNGGISAIFSLEMGEKSLNKRLLSTMGKIDGHKMKNPKQFFNNDDWNDFSDALGILSSMNMKIYDKSGQTIPYIRSKVSKLRRDNPDGDILVMIDYLQLIRSTEKFESKNNEVGEISRSLKEMARDFDVPVYLLSQLSRGVESRQDKRPMMSDIRDSGSIEQDADVIEFLYRDDYYDKETEKENIIEVIIAKQRNGAVGTVELAFLKEFNLFADLAYHDA